MIKFPRVRTLSNIDRAAWSNLHGLACPEPSMAIQSQKEEADINTIVRNFGVTGRLPQSLRLPEYGDFSGIDDYATAIEAVRRAEANFMSIPSNIRAEFNNDPGAFADFCVNPANLPKLREWGLAPNPSTPEPSKAPE